MARVHSRIWARGRGLRGDRSSPRTTWTLPGANLTVTFTPVARASTRRYPAPLARRCRFGVGAGWPGSNPSCSREPGTGLWWSRRDPVPPAGPLLGRHAAGPTERSPPASIPLSGSSPGQRGQEGSAVPPLDGAVGTGGGFGDLEVFDSGRAGHSTRHPRGLFRARARLDPTIHSRLEDGRGDHRCSCRDRSRRPRELRLGSQ